MKLLFNRCRPYREGISLLASGILQGEEKTVVEDHLADCADCQKHYAEMKMVAELLVDCGRSSPDIQPHPDLQARWAKAIQAAGATSPVFHPWLGFGPRSWWRELLWPCPQAWSGLAALWLLIFAANMATREKPALIAKALPPPSPAMIMALKEQEQLLAELIRPRGPIVAEHPKSIPPKPRSEGPPETAAG